MNIKEKKKEYLKNWPKSKFDSGDKTIEECFSLVEKGICVWVLTDNLTTWRLVLAE